MVNFTCFLQIFHDVEKKILNANEQQQQHIALDVGTYEIST